MKDPHGFIGRQAASSLIALLVVLLAAPVSQAAPSPQYAGQAQSATAVVDQSQNAQSATGAGSQGTVPGQAAAPLASNAQQQPSAPPKPVGTAAAPYEKPEGITGSRPAGAVIAPAKQRRVHAFLIKFGIVIGAGAAVGAVIALSHASPSQPH